MVFSNERLDAMDLLDEKVESSGSVQRFCPFCGSTLLALSFRTAKDGKVLLHCVCAGYVAGDRNSSGCGYVRKQSLPIGSFRLSLDDNSFLMGVANLEGAEDPVPEPLPLLNCRPLRFNRQLFAGVTAPGHYLRIESTDIPEGAKVVGVSMNDPNSPDIEVLMKHSSFGASRAPLNGPMFTEYFEKAIVEKHQKVNPSLSVSMLQAGWRVKMLEDGRVQWLSPIHPDGADPEDYRSDSLDSPPPEAVDTFMINTPRRSLQS